MCRMLSYKTLLKIMEYEIWIGADDEVFSEHRLRAAAKLGSVGAAHQENCTDEEETHR